MKKAFTLLELMVVMAIMGSMAAMAIGGYRSYIRGMADRSALVAVQSMVDMAAQRAEVDRRPAVIYFYDELLQRDDEGKGRDRAGHGIAYAIRPEGRVTMVDGDRIYDEFGPDGGEGVLRGRLYLMDGTAKSFVVEDMKREYRDEVFVMTGQELGKDTENLPTSVQGLLKEESPKSGKQILTYAWRMTSGDVPRPGDVFGVKFATCTLPDGYFFTASPPSQIGQPTTPTKTIRISADGSGTESVDVYRWTSQDNATVKVGTTKARN